MGGIDLLTIKKANQYTHNLLGDRFSFSFERGGLNAPGGVENPSNNRARIVDVIRPGETRGMYILRKDPTYLVGVFTYDNGVWDGVDLGWLDLDRIEIPAGKELRFHVRKRDNSVFSIDEVQKLADCFEVRHYGFKVETLNRLADKIESDVFSSILVEYGRVDGASYVFLRIPKVLNDGRSVMPRVRLTSVDGSLSGPKRSALEYARSSNSIVTINAGLFNVSTREPVGQTIIDGVSLVNTPMTDDNGTPIHPDECYPLAIDGSGNLTTYPKNADTADMIADGIVHAVTGWGRLVDNFAIDQESIDNEIVHGGSKRYIRQSIGQFQNGDYCVCTVDQTRGPVTNEAGLTYTALAQLLVDKGVKFAYSLDGGGSAQTVIGKRQLNPIYEGVTGRKVATIITFDVV